MRARLRVFGACAATAILGACVGEGPVHESRIEARLPAKVAPIVVGQTDRAAVRQVLGKPWLASEHWGLDVFRIADSNVNMVMILIPVWLSTDGTKGYVLVTYDASGKVTGYGKDIASEGNLVAGTTDRGAAVQAEDVRLAVSGDGSERVVAVAGLRRDEYFKSESATDACRLLVGCGGDWCGARVEIDGGAEVEMPNATTRWLPAVAPFDLKAGGHQINIRSARWDLVFEAKSQFSCTAGESLYALINFPVTDESAPRGFRKEVSATLTIARDMPSVFLDQGLLIYANGRWLVPQEP